MLKGVNKKVVEVVDIENEYFEKAILFIKHEKLVKDEKTIKERANQYLNNISYAPRKSFAFGKVALYLILTAAIAAIIIGVTTVII